MKKQPKKKTTRNAMYALMTASSLLLGCELPKDGTGGSQLPQGCFLEEFPRSTQTTQALDLLFVVDTSGSMTNKKARLAEGIESFVSELSPQTDLRIAVMPAHGSRGAYTGALYKYKNNPYVLSPKTMSASELRRALYENMVEAPDDRYSGGGEEGLYSVYRSIENGKLNAIRAQGFYRKDAALAVVFVADENDICARYPAGVKRVPDPSGMEADAFERDCRSVDQNSVYQRLQTLQNGRPLIVSGVVYNDLTTIPKNTGGEDEYGYGYMDLIKLAHGVSVDIAKGNYDEGLAQIGQFASQKMQPTVDFKLANSPVDPHSIVVALRSSSVHSDDDDSKGSCSCHKEDGDNGSNRHCEADDKSKFVPGYNAKSQSNSKSKSKSNSGHGSDDQDLGRIVDFSFDDQSNIVHLLDETAPEPLAEIQYCLKQIVPSPSPTVSPSPSPSTSPVPVPSPTVTVTPSPTPTVTVTPSPSPTVTVTPSPSPTVTVTPEPSPTVTVTPEPTPTVTVTPSPTPTVTVTPEPTPTVTVTPEPTPTVTVTPSPSPTVTVTPSPEPTPTVTVTPDPTPTVTVTPEPSPSPSPTVTITPEPSPSPTGCTGPFCGPGGAT
ncbi:MAG: hypothetical protein ACJ763_04650 [Bdellovibrionia bacterium]